MARLRNGLFAILFIRLIKVTTGIENPATYTQDVSALFANVFSDYHAGVPPIDIGNPVVRVETGLSLISFHFIDEATGLMSIHGWLKLAWTDSRLQWDPASYGNITSVRVDPTHLWQPDITLYNGIKVTKVMDHKVLLYDSGFIYSLPSYRVEFKCEMNLRYFPYDEHNCNLIYGSWAHDTTLLRMFLMGGDTIDTLDMHPSQDFVLLETSQELINLTYPCCSEVFQECHFTLKIKRSSGAYSAKLILPSVLSGLMVLATFLLPPASHEKITLCGITFLTLVVLLDYLQSIVPASGDTIIGEYLAFALCIDFFATILAVISYVLDGRGNQPLKSAFEGDDHDLKLQSPQITKTAWLRYLDLASFVFFSVVFVIGAAIMLGRRG